MAGKRRNAHELSCLYGWFCSVSTLSSAFGRFYSWGSGQVGSHNRAGAGLTTGQLHPPHGNLGFS